MTRLAVAGLGLIGREHAARISASPNTELVAVVDPVADLSAWDCAGFRDLDELISAGLADGVVLATPNALHAAQTRQCVDAGLSVLVEKPLATTLEDAQSLVGLSDRVLVGHHRVHSSLLARARTAVADGLLGDLVAFQGSALFYKPAHYFADGPWRCQPGGGPIAINLIHEIGNMRALMGEISEVSAVSSNARRGFVVEDSLALSLRFASGALGTFLLSDCAASTQSWEQTSGENPSYFRDAQAPCYHIAGTQGSLTLPSLRLQRFDRVEPSWWQPMVSEVLAQTPNDPLVAQIEHFVEVTRGQAMPLCSLADGAANLAVLDAVQRSISEARPVRV